MNKQPDSQYGEFLPLLTTKLYIPRPRPNQVSRSHLIDRLNESQSRKITLISAPPGFGKTTLLSAWIPQNQYCVTWVSLDTADNAPFLFWTYIISALQMLDAHLGERALSILRSSQAVSLESVISTLINEIAAFSDRFTLVLDDYHVITSEAIHNSFIFLIDHQPPQMHLIINTRMDPPFPLAQLRARGELTELRADDLRFNFDEAALLLNQIAGLNLTAQDVAALESRTEGWIAGLQLAALSMQGHSDCTSFINAFTGSHRFVLDYLSDQVLQQQPEDLRLFLLQTSILDRVSAPLCDALTGHTDSQAMLEIVDQRNLFLIPLDDDRRWYRYHHLFADVLKHRLKEEQPDTMLELHRRASEWYERAGLLPQAVHHTLAAKEYERAVRLIERVADSVWQRGEITSLTSWMKALPDAIRRAHPMLCLDYARFLAGAFQNVAVETIVREVELGLETNTPTNDQEAASSRGRVAALSAHLASLNNDFSQSIELSHRAQELIPRDDSRWRGFIALNLAGAYRFTSRWEEASQTYLEAATFCQLAENRVDALAALGLRGEVLQAQGQLREAAQQFEQVLRLAQAWDIPYSPAIGYALTGLGRVWCEWNDLDAALRYARAGLEHGTQADFVDVMLRGYLALVRIRKAQGDLDGALALLEDVEPVVQRMDVPEVKEWVNAFRAQVWLEKGYLEAAFHWAAGHTSNVHDGIYPTIPVALAQVWLAQGRPDQALQLLDHALQAAEQVGRLGNAIQILVVKALTHRARGDPDRALIDLEKALELAEPEGYFRVFMDEGKPILRLLARTAARNPASGYIQKLLEGLGGPVAIEPIASPQLIEPLTTRELQVLRLIADGATNQEIANELVLSIYTVKKHISNIYGKLGVDNRVQAVARARHLGLL
jgi:LuxR family maltose regulon positive regulatory protein